jgi:hypothetical protein
MSYKPVSLPIRGNNTCLTDAIPFGIILVDDTTTSDTPSRPLFLQLPPRRRHTQGGNQWLCILLFFISIMPRIIDGRLYLDNGSPANIDDAMSEFDIIIVTIGIKTGVFLDWYIETHHLR